VEPLLREITFRATAAESHAAALAVLAGHREVDAVICSSDTGSLGVLRAAGECGRRVPEDLLVASCVDAPALDSTQPTVTALSLHPRDLGARCAQVLLELLGGGVVGPEPELHPVDLVVRSSTTR